MKKILIFILLLIPLNIKATETETFSSSGQCTILMDMDSKRILYIQSDKYFK